MFKEGLLKGKRILVTGGGTGLGKEMATHYASLGADIVICGRRLNVLEETADEIKSNHDVDVLALIVKSPFAVVMLPLIVMSRPAKNERFPPEEPVAAIAFDMVMS